MSAPKAEAAATLAGVIAAARRRLGQGDLDDPALEARLIVEHFTGTERGDADPNAGASGRARPRRSDRPGDRAAACRRACPQDFRLPRLLRAEARAVSRDAGAAPRHRDAGRRDPAFPSRGGEAGRAMPHPRPRHGNRGDRACAGFANPGVAGDGNRHLRRSARDRSRQCRRCGRLQPLHARCIPTGFRQLAGNFMQSSQTLPIYAVKRSMACKPKYGSTIRAVALDGGPDGLDAYRHIADGAAAHLEHDGQVAVEIGHTQRQEVGRLFAQAGYQLISMHRDLAGSDRAMVFSR